MVNIVSESVGSDIERALIWVCRPSSLVSLSQSQSSTVFTEAEGGVTSNLLDGRREVQLHPFAEGGTVGRP
jgi:hypothetical protein